MAVNGKYDGINKRLLAYLNQHPRACYGTVPMDFPELPDGGAIIAKLIASND